MAVDKGIFDIVGEFVGNYKSKTEARLKLIDAFIAYLLLTGVIQFVYCALVGTFPFNSFLSGFIVTISIAVFSVALRLQVGKDAGEEFKEHFSPQRSYADFCFASLLFFLVTLMFIG